MSVQPSHSLLESELETLPSPAAHPDDNASDWVLRVQCPLHSQQQGSNGVVRVQVYEGMNSELLAACATKAVSAASGIPYDHMVGLFGLDDGIFHSFEDILKHPDLNSIYSTSPSLPPRRPRRQYGFTILAWVAAAFLLVLTVFTSTGRERLYQVHQHLFHVLFELPLKELYRYGPHVIGWEGLALPEVCTRVTFYGHYDFWARNLAECQEIYAGKEAAFLRVMRPLTYLCLAWILVWMVRHFVAVYAESKRNRTDRAVMETYHAFQTLVRVAANHHHQQQQQQQHNMEARSR